MYEAFILESNSELVFCREEALVLSEGNPVIEGTFRQTGGTWTGIFESIDGDSYEIKEGYIAGELVY